MKAHGRSDKVARTATFCVNPTQPAPMSSIISYHTRRHRLVSLLLLVCVAVLSSPSRSTPRPFFCCAAMSIADLLAHLQWPDPPPPPPSDAQAPSLPASTLPLFPSHFIVVQDSLATPADFLVLSFLSCALRCGQCVALVHSARSAQHYRQLARKWVRPARRCAADPKLRTRSRAERSPLPRCPLCLERCAVAVAAFVRGARSAAPGRPLRARAGDGGRLLRLGTRRR